MENGDGKGLQLPLEQALQSDLSDSSKPPLERDSAKEVPQCELSPGCPLKAHRQLAPCLRRSSLAFTADSEEFCDCA